MTKPIWLNTPRQWHASDDTLSLVTDLRTDFWRNTFYGFVRDSGHALLSEVHGDFSAEVSVTAAYETLYDQAGLMLRIDNKCWLKAGIEFTDGLMHFSTVLTNPDSDWSVIPLPLAQTHKPVHIRITRHDTALRVQFRLDDTYWQMARLCPFPSEPATIGPMACSPERTGLKAEFKGFEIGPPISRELHD